MAFSNSSIRTTLGLAEEAVDVLVGLYSAEMAVIAGNSHQQPAEAHINFHPVAFFVRKVEHAPVHRVLALVFQTQRRLNS